MPHRLLSAALLAALLLSPPAARALIDANNDGIDDIWAARHGGSLPPAADPDGDGQPNSAEAVAGTDPHDPQSRLAIRAITLSPAGEAGLRWPSAPAKLYRIQASSDLSNWIDLSATREGDGGELSLTLPLARTYSGGDFAVSRWDNLADDVWLWAFKNIVTAGTPAATRTLRLPRFELPQSDPNLDHFGHHARGWIVPPADGAYRFFIAGDDVAEFWLSPTASATGRQRIAYLPGWTEAREWSKYPEQTSAPITLQGGRPYYFEFFHIEGGWGDHFALAWTGPGLDPDKEILDARYYADDPRSLAERLGGAAFFRVSVEDLDSDGDGVSDHDEKFLGTDPLDPTTQPRVPDRDAAVARLAAANRLTLGSASPRAYELGSAPARVTVFRSGNLNPLTARYTVSGTAQSGVDYTALSGTLVIPAGADRAEFDVRPLSDLLLENTEAITISLSADPAYELGTPAQTTVTVDDAPDELFLAQLRPPAGVVSGAWGYAAVRAMGNGLSARVSVSVSALQAPQTEARLYVSGTGGAGPIVLTLPAGPVTARPWDLSPAAGQSHEAILAALREGRLWAGIPSATVPDGEILGQLLPATGSEAMPTPPPPVALPGGTPSLAEASRFLNQATFGASPATVAALRAQGYAAWIDAQRTLPATYLLPQVRARRAELLARSGGQEDGWQDPFQESWWQNALTAPDQLRQRVAWALSQILVVSQEGALADKHEPATAYYDLLLSHALGNYRELLGDVTRSPAMGTYLSMMRNQKPNPETGQRPDENYAREVMQLFSIGLNELHPDGTLRLDAQGLPRPTYTQADIAGLARVFTGWGPYYDEASPPEWSPGDVASPEAWFLYGEDLDHPMTFYPGFHDTGAKTIVRGVVVPAGTDGIVALNTALDTLFNHPSAGPFLARQLIQKLVTSNPSPGYVCRVAAAFADNGTGVRGDLFATVRAILLDPEARVPAPANSVSYGKRAEPVLRLSRFYRAFPPALPRAGDPRYFLSHQYDLAHQVPLGSPSVFNFCQPVYAQPGAIAAAGLVSPEFQITSETTVIGEANRFYEDMNWGKETAEPSDPAVPGSEMLHLDIPLDEELAILARTPATPAENYAALVDHLGEKLLGGRVSPALRTELLELNAALPSWYWQATGDDLLERRLTVIRYALTLLLIAPETVIDK